MNIDTRLVSLRDGGKVAMSWIAETNPRILRSRFQSSQIYTIDVPEVCDKIMEIIKSKENKISFRNLFKLYFDMIYIFGIQVEQLYNVTQNFLCFHRFDIKLYSRKRKSSENTHSQSKNRRLNSFDFTSLLLESEDVYKYSEKDFSLPKEIGSSSRRKNTSTCIEIKQITIKQVNWDNPEEKEDMFGEATEHEKLMLLSTLNGTMEDEFSLQSLTHRKRKSSLQIADSPPFKKKGVLDESVDEFRCTPSNYNDSQSELSVFKNHPTMEINILDDTQRNIVHDNSVYESSSIEDHISFPVTSANIHTSNERCSLNNVPESLPFVEHQSYPTFCEIAIQNKRQIKRRSSRYSPVIDMATQMPTRELATLLENVWFNCHNREKKEHIARAVTSRMHTNPFNISVPNQRFQSGKLLGLFNKYLKCKLNQDVALNRELIIKDIFDNEYDLYKNEIMPQSQNRAKIRKLDIDENIEGFVVLAHDENNNISLGQDLNNNNTQPNTPNENNQNYSDDMPLRCSINKIDLNKISFDFPNEAEKQRSEWCKESILMKLLLAWKSGEPIVNMKSIIYGANRINAALTFHTLLYLAGQHYIKLEKTETNAIKSIQMGTALIRRLNETFS